MIRKCHSCGNPLSHYDKRCPKCGSDQKSSKIVRKAGVTVKRPAKPMRGSQLDKDPKR